MVDGEMQADTAVTPEIIEQDYPFSTLKGGANVLIFPNLEAGTSLTSCWRASAARRPIGPILMGLSKPVHVLQRGAEVNDIVNMAAIAVVDAQDGLVASFDRRGTAASGVRGLIGDPRNPLGLESRCNRTRQALPRLWSRNPRNRTTEGSARLE